VYGCPGQVANLHEHWITAAVESESRDAEACMGRNILSASDLLCYKLERPWKLIIQTF
jgi:hypothetical protein